MKLTREELQGMIDEYYRDWEVEEYELNSNSAHIAVDAPFGLVLINLVKKFTKATVKLETSIDDDKLPEDIIKNLEKLIEYRETLAGRGYIGKKAYEKCSHPECYVAISYRYELPIGSKQDLAGVLKGFKVTKEDIKEHYEKDFIEKFDRVRRYFHGKLEDFRDKGE